MTVEVVGISSGEKGGEIKPVYIEMKGDTFFDAARRAVSLAGKRLYWSHAKVMVLSQDIAGHDVDRVLDFVERDAEVREDMWLVVSKEKTAVEVLKSKPVIEKIVSFEIDSMMRAQKSVSRFPSVELYMFVNRLQGNKEDAFLPAAKMVETKDGKTLHMSGTAVFDKNRLTGWLDEPESKLLLCIRNELEGGLFIIEKAAGTDTDVALEIYQNKTKVEPMISGETIMFDINIKPVVYIAELEGNTDFISKKGRDRLKKSAEERIKRILRNS